MIAEELRQAIRALKDQGRPLREISRALKVSRNTVRRVLREREQRKVPAANPRTQVIAELLPDLYRDCKGNAVRIGEVLNEIHGIDIAYSTLTRLIREHTDLRTPKKRSGTYTFGPGEEMQHDTSPHRVTLGGKAVKIQCASLVLAYSRMLFVQYYPRFTRFEAKAFLTAALQFFGGAARRCVIDNTSVILAGGSGPNALIAPERQRPSASCSGSNSWPMPSGIRIARGASSGRFLTSRTISSPVVPSPTGPTSTPRPVPGARGSPTPSPSGCWA